MTLKLSSSSVPQTILTDICSKKNQKIIYKKVRGRELIFVEQRSGKAWDIKGYFNALLKDIFLPRGYPDSVSSDYLEYQIWDTCQAFCSSISSTLTMKAIMQGIGVGSEAATPVSAAITWVIKEGTGIIGSILFAWSKGSKLDSECKKWRLFADILNDIAMFIELSIPYLIHYSMHMLCLATLFKAVVGTAGSSTRAALVTHQAISRNAADVSAKDGSQEVFTNLCAFVFGIFLLKHVTETQQIWAVMCTAIFFHLLFNYKAVRCLKINVFNSERFLLGLRIYLPTSSVPTVEQVNRRESVFLTMGVTDKAICGFSIVFGPCLKAVLDGKQITAVQLNFLTTLFEDKNYLILPNLYEKKLFVTFRKTFSDNDVLKAYFHASLIGIALTHFRRRKLHILSRSRKHSPLYRLKNILNGSRLTSQIEMDDEMITIFTICEDFIEKEFAAFCHACKLVGWDLDKHQIIIGDWRADWVYSFARKGVANLKVTHKRTTTDHGRAGHRPSSRSTTDHVTSARNSQVGLNLSTLVIS